MTYAVGVRLSTGEIAKRYCENIVDLPDVTDDGETLCVLYGADDFPITADFCNAARLHRAYWRKEYAAAGVRYPE
jgi:hypothetical protein